MKPAAQTIGIGGVLTPAQVEEHRLKQFRGVQSRLQRAYARHRKDVMMVDPGLAEMLVDDGFAVRCAPADYDDSLDRRFLFDPKHHAPVRLRRVQVGTK